MLPSLLQKPVLVVTHCDGNTVAGQLKTQQNIAEQCSVQKKSMTSVCSSVCQITAQHATDISQDDTNLSNGGLLHPPLMV